MITIARGASASVNIPVGYVLNTSGAGLLVFGYGSMSGQSRALNGDTTTGPFDVARVVYLTAGYNFNYEINNPLGAVNAEQDSNGNTTGLNSGGNIYALARRTYSRPPDITDNLSRGYTINSIWQAAGKLYQPVVAPDSSSAVWGDVAGHGGAFVDIMGAANTVSAFGTVAMLTGFTGPAVDISVTIATVATTFTLNILAGGELDNAAAFAAIRQADSGTYPTAIKMYDQSGVGNHWVKSASYPAPYFLYDAGERRFGINSNGPYGGAPRTLRAPDGTFSAGALTGGFGVVGNAYTVFCYGRGNSSASNGLPALYALGDKANADNRFSSLLLNALGYMYVSRSFAGSMGSAPVPVDCQAHAVVVSSAGTSLTVSANEITSTVTQTNDTATYSSGWLGCYDPRNNDYALSHMIFGFGVAKIGATAAQMKALRYSAYIRYDIRPQVLDQIFCAGDSRTSHARPSTLPFDSWPKQMALYLGKEFRVYNYGNTGYTCAQVLAGPLPTIVSQYAADGRKNHALFLCGVNDASAGATAAQVVANMQSCTTPLKAAGFKIGLFNELTTSNAPASTTLPAVRALVTAAGAAAMGANYIVDALQYAAFQSAGNAVMYPDQLHLSAAADAALGSLPVPFL